MQPAATSLLGAMVYAMKRNGGSDTTPSKAQKGPNPSDPDSWTCEKCGNVNYGHRATCNMRSCGAPKDEDGEGSWVCPGCGNENRAGRMFCNMRRCQQVRPGATMKQLQAQMSLGHSGKGGAGVTVPMGKGGKGYGPPPFMVAGYGQASSDPRAREEGAWTCVCGNLNYAGRAVCNSRSCGKPRPAPQQFWGGYTGAPYGYAPPAYAPPAYGGGHAGKGGSSERPPPEGSWQCSACQNVNWPTRDTCNAKACGQPRHLVDGGAPGKAPQQAAPEGSWTCPSCQNVNFPTRTHCNKRTCGLAKPI